MDSSSTSKSKLPRSVFMCSRDGMLYSPNVCAISYISIGIGTSLLFERQMAILNYFLKKFITENFLVIFLKCGKQTCALNFLFFFFFFRAHTKVDIRLFTHSYPSCPFKDTKYGKQTDWSRSATFIKKTITSVVEINRRNLI